MTDGEEMTNGELFDKELTKLAKKYKVDSLIAAYTTADGFIGLTGRGCPVWRIGATELLKQQAALAVSSQIWKDDELQ